MKTIIAGGRDYEFKASDIEFLNGLKNEISEIVCGGASGADSEGKKWAETNKISVKMFPADWKKFGRGAGPKRNKEMADYADCLILFSGGRGSANMLKTAQTKGLKIYNMG